ncbi:MAG: FG-GAP-like repeat-containing protein [Bacteroidota bacterium]|nr:FG-GAP-like repeat-containing protein [Bacteroidota bacterium]MDE2955971.1 FG-GAP-like repeat-containing protein [Bacteroidota bacterium]
MRKITFLAALLFCVGIVSAQKTDFVWVPDPEMGFGIHPLLQVPNPPAYWSGRHSGARTVAGPFDFDSDGKVDVILTDYTGGGRIHIVENAGVDMWELVYSSPLVDSTSTSGNARGVTIGDLDGDGLSEVYIFMGRGYSATNALVSTLGLRPGLWATEATGNDNELGALPYVYEFDGDLPDRIIAEQMTIADVDDDGANELMFGNNGRDNRFDNWYVLNGQGLGTAFAFLGQEARWSSRATEDFDPINRGGGSAYGIVPADLNGDGMMELQMSSWNNLNFTNATVTGPDTYMAPTASDTAAWYQARSVDDVVLFGCSVVDMDMNGDDEVYCPSYNTGNLALINYEAGEDVLSISADQVIFPLLEGVSSLGLTVGDIDMDGIPELIGSGPSYTASQFLAGNAPRWVRIVDYNGEGDVEDPASYSVREVEFPDDMVNQFHTVNRDSAGVMTTYLETPRTSGGQPNPEFAGKLAFLGDADGDGQMEVAMSFQGVNDSTYVYKEVFNPADSTYERTVEDSSPHPKRAFMRIMSGDGLSTNITYERIIVPSDYILGGNYPNPFNPTTNFDFTLPLDKRISVRIYDVSGRLVRTLINGEYFAKGTHTVAWNGRNDAGAPVASGAYIYTLEWGQFRQSRSMILAK